LFDVARRELNDETWNGPESVINVDNTEASDTNNIFVANYNIQVETGDVLQSFHSLGIQWQTALCELVDNAIEATAETDTLRHIRIKFDAKEQEIVIYDNGIGMGPEELPNLWAKLGKTHYRTPRNQLKISDPVGKNSLTQ